LSIMCPACGKRTRLRVKDLGSEIACGCRERVRINPFVVMKHSGLWKRLWQ
jgi:hypothetical protein